MIVISVRNVWAQSAPIYENAIVIACIEVCRYAWCLIDAETKNAIIRYRQSYRYALTSGQDVNFKEFCRWSDVWCADGLIVYGMCVDGELYSTTYAGERYQYCWVSVEKGGRDYFIASYPHTNLSTYSALFLTTNCNSDWFGYSKTNSNSSSWCISSLNFPYEMQKRDRICRQRRWTVYFLKRCVVWRYLSNYKRTGKKRWKRNVR